MNPAEGNQPGTASPSGGQELSPKLDDPRVTQALEEYLAELEAGEKLDRQQFQARYPDIAEALAECLAGLDFVQAAAPELEEPDPDGSGLAPAASTAVEPEGPLGDFRIVGEIGRGGMGVVYEAVQISLGRRVALKVLPFAAALDAKQLQRFKNEAQAAAHLHHTNIVPVFAVGCERGVHYYAMQFIEGQTLAAVIQELRQHGEDRMTHDERMTKDPSPSPQDPVPGADAQTNLRHSTVGLLSSLDLRHGSFFQTTARLGVQAAVALEHAHQLGVIHRDIKPANLLVDAGGRLWIADFGLAHCQSQPGLTMTGDVVGTLRYMSPEQALAKRVTLDARTDVYSLGATLYELLTLQPAYNGRNREEVLRQIAFEEPRLPSRLNQAVPAELETIVLKAMAKVAEERYATAQELADDLERYLKDEPIRARRPTLVQRLKKWTRRHLAIVWTAGLSFVVMLVLAVIGLTASTVLVMREKVQTDAAKEDLERTLYNQRIALAQLEWSANNLGRVEQLLDDCRADLRGWEWRSLKRLRLESVPPLRHADAVLSAVISPDGRWIVSGSTDGKVTVWDATTGQEVVPFPAHKWHVHSMAFSPDGRLLATASWDKTVKVWGFDLPPAARVVPPLIHTLQHQEPISSVAFSPDSERLASAGDDKTVRVWDVVTGQEMFSLCGHTDVIWCVAYSPDGQSLASGSADTTMRIWNATTRRELRTLRGHSAPVSCVTFNQDGKELASATMAADSELIIWDTQTGRENRSLRGHVGWVTSVAFSPDGRRLASAGVDNNVKLWDPATGREILTLREHTNTVRSVAFSRGGNRLVSASADRSVRVWNATPLEGEARQELLTLRGHTGAVRGVTFSPDGRHLASTGDDATVRFWDFRRGLAGIDPLVKLLPGGKGVNRNVAFSKDGLLLASGDGGGHLGGHVGARLRVWDVTTWEELPTNPTATCPVAFSPTGQHLAAVSADFAIEICEARTVRVVHAPLKGHSWAINALVFSPDPDVARLASASNDGTVRIWDLSAGKEIVESPLRHEDEVSEVAFSGNGRCLASGSRDRTVRVWNAKTWQLLATLPDPTGAVQNVAIHPKDDRVLAWGSTDSAVKVWNRATKEIRTLHGHMRRVTSVAFSPDGEWIASASLDRTVKIWKAPPLVELRPSGAR